MSSHDRDGLAFGGFEGDGSGTDRDSLAVGGFESDERGGPMIKPSVEWVDSLVAKRRGRGGYSDEELAAYRAELMAKYGLRDAPATCEQNCGATATVYAIDPHPGGWGGRYCAACANALGFQVTDVL